MLFTHKILFIFIIPLGFRKPKYIFVFFNKVKTHRLVKLNQQKSHEVTERTLHSSVEFQKPLKYCPLQNLLLIYTSFSSDQTIRLHI